MGADFYRMMSRFDGLPYVYGAEYDGWSLEDILRRRLPGDCSETTQTSARFCAINPLLPDGANAQLQHCRAHGTMLPVARAIHVEGSLGFVVSSAGAHHVVSFAGDGRTTMEAANPRIGQGHFSVFQGGGLRFNFAAAIPGVWYPELASPGIPQVTPNPSAQAQFFAEIDHAKTTIIGFAPNEIHHGAEVRVLQILLNGKMKVSPALTLSGDLDLRTQLALIAFKRTHGISNPNVAACAIDCWSALLS